MVEQDTEFPLLMCNGIELSRMDDFPLRRPGIRLSCSKASYLPVFCPSRDKTSLTCCIAGFFPYVASGFKLWQTCQRLLLLCLLVPSEVFVFNPGKCLSLGDL